LKTYPILAGSGTLGPKLVEGDGQVPEGLYRVESLNPNSSFHLALRVNYPNEFDRAKGKLDGPGQTHLNSQQAQQVGVIPPGIKLFAADAAFLGALTLKQI
jgi:hypothetical protein